MERNFFLKSCLVFLFLSTGNIKLSEEGKRVMKNEIPRSFPNPCSMNDWSYCMTGPSLHFRVDSAKHFTNHFFNNPLLSFLKIEDISKNELLQENYDSSLDAENTSEIRTLEYENLQRDVKEMIDQFRYHRKTHSNALRKPELQTFKTVFQYYNSNGEQEECELFFENRTGTFNNIKFLKFGKTKTRLKDYEKSILNSTGIISLSSLRPTGSIPLQSFSSTQPPVINEFYSDSPVLHALVKKKDLVPVAEELQATPAIDINTLMAIPTSHQAIPATLSANTLKGSFASFTPSSGELVSYSSSALLSSSEDCQETSSVAPTPAMGTSVTSEPLCSSAGSGSDVSTNSGEQLSASDGVYASCVSSEPFSSGSPSPGIIYPSSCASESSTGSNDVFSMYGFADLSHEMVEY